MLRQSRSFTLGIWGLAVGYFAFYLPYCVLVKATTQGLLPGVPPPSGFEMLPATGIATAATMLLIITAMGWWKYSGRRRVLGLTIPCPTPWTLIAGLGTAAIIYTTTLVYTFVGVSILLAMLMLRAGVLLLAPTLDTAFGKRVRWFSWAALGLSVMALLAALSDVSNYNMTIGVVLTVGVYLAGYSVRLPSMNRVAKSSDPAATRRYFVEEQMVAMTALIVAPVVVALLGKGSTAMGLRHGFTSFFGTPALWPSLLIGVLYACLCVFGTLIYLDRRENTYCIPLNRCSSLLSAIAGSFVLTFAFAERTPGVGELSGAALVLTAILILSPLHHGRRQLAALARLLSESQLTNLGPAIGEARLAREDSLLLDSAGSKDRVTAAHEIEPALVKGLRRVFLFVCNGNTGRSPMAQAICNRLIARRLGVSVEALATDNVLAISAGLKARPGSPLKPTAQIALQSLRVNIPGHTSQTVTREMVEQAERVFCMTESQRQEVIAGFLAPPDKVFLLDPQGDIEEPSDADSDAYLNCAKRIWMLVSRRLDELGVGPLLSAGAAGS